MNITALFSVYRCGSLIAIKKLLRPGFSRQKEKTVLKNTLRVISAAALLMWAGTALAQNEVIGDTGTDTVNNTSGTDNVSGNLILGNQSTGNGTYNLTYGGTLTVSGNATIGEAGTGTYNQGILDQSDASSVNNATITGDMTLGDQFFSSGTVNVNNGILTVGGTLFVGNLGNAVVNQTGGTVNAGSLTIANSGSSIEPVNSYYLTGSGVLNITGNEVVGELGNGVFVQGNGTDSPTHNVGGTLIVGDGVTVTPLGAPTPNPRQGSFILNSGSLLTNSLIVGNQGIGFFTQNGGSVSVQDQLTLGSQATTPYLDGGGNTVGGLSQGTYSLSGGSLQTGGNLTVGDAGVGILNQTGGTLLVGLSPNSSTPFVMDLVVGAQAGSSGTYSLSNGGSATVNGNLVIGRNSASGGMVTVGSAGNNNNNNDPTNLNVNDTIIVGSGGTGTLTQYSGAVTAGNVSIGGGGGVDGGGFYLDGGTGTYNLAGGTLTTSLLEVGHAGTGTFNQSGGTVNASWTLWLGNAGGSNGTYNLSSGTLNAGGEQIGLFGSGTFNQSGGTNNSAAGLWIGGGGGTYTMTGGVLNADSIIVGNNGNGTFNQSGTGSAVNVNGTLWIGNPSGAIYTLSGGTLTTGITGASFTNGGNLGDVIIGLNGTGELDNSGGVQTSLSNGGFTLGWDSAGTYKLTGTGVLNVASNENIGGFGIGTFVQGDGKGTTSNTVGGSILMSGGSGGPTSSYTLTDGTLNVSGDIIVGFAAESVFTQTGGNNTVGGDLTLGLMFNPDDLTQVGNGTYTLGGTGNLSVAGGLTLGSQQGTIGVFNFNTQAGDNATISNLGGSLVVGDAGSGTFNQGGGAFTATGGLTVGQSVGGVGIYNLTGGTVNGATIIGDAGTGTFNNMGGTHNVTGDLTVGNQAGSNGTYNLGGGALYVSGNALIGNLGTGTFNESNGTASVNGTMTIAATGSAKLTGGLLTAGAIINAGTVQVGAGSTLTSLGAFANNSGGTLTVTGGTVNANSISNGGGKVQGTGTINGLVTMSSGLLIPGMPGIPGTLSIGGSFTQTGGTFDELIGSATDNGLLDVSGSATLGGTARLEISLLNGFTPTYGETFDIMDYSSETGEFANAGGQFTQDGLTWTINYEGNEVLLTDVTQGSTPPPVPEPGSLILLGSGLASFLAAYRRRICR